MLPNKDKSGFDAISIDLHPEESPELQTTEKTAVDMAISSVQLFKVVHDNRLTPYVPPIMG